MTNTVLYAASRNTAVGGLKRYQSCNCYAFVWQTIKQLLTDLSLITINPLCQNVSWPICKTTPLSEYQQMLNYKLFCFFSSPLATAKLHSTLHIKLYPQRRLSVYLPQHECESCGPTVLANLLQWLLYLAIKLKHFQHDFNHVNPSKFPAPANFWGRLLWPWTDNIWSNHIICICVCYVRWPYLHTTKVSNVKQVEIWINDAGAVLLSIKTSKENSI